jgi:hypothetical protein
MSKKQKHCFSLFTKARSYYIFASSDQEMNSWISTLRDVVENLRRKEGTKEKSKNF